MTSLCNIGSNLVYAKGRFHLTTGDNWWQAQWGSCENLFSHFRDGSSQSAGWDQIRLGNNRLESPGLFPVLRDKFLGKVF